MKIMTLNITLSMSDEDYATLENATLEVFESFESAIDAWDERVRDASDQIKDKYKQLANVKITYNCE